MVRKFRGVGVGEREKRTETHLHALVSKERILEVCHVAVYYCLGLVKSYVGGPGAHHTPYCHQGEKWTWDAELWCFVEWDCLPLCNLVCLILAMAELKCGDVKLPPTSF